MITKKELRDRNIKLTREQISVRAMEIAKSCAGGSYKNAVACVGRMVALSKTIDDVYWSEKYGLGEMLEGYYLLSNLDPEHPDKNSEVN